MRSMLGISLVAAMAACAAPGVSHGGEPAGSQPGGARDIVTQSRAVGGFHAIALGGPTDLILKQGARESLTVRAERRLLPYIVVAQKDDRLELGLERLPLELQRDDARRTPVF